MFSGCVPFLNLQLYLAFHASAHVAHVSISKVKSCGQISKHLFTQKTARRFRVLSEDRYLHVCCI